MAKDLGNFSLSSVGGGGGTVTGATNIGTGADIFGSQVSGVLEFKTLVAGPGISIQSSTSEVTITNTSSSQDAKFDSLVVDTTTRLHSLSVDVRNQADNSALLATDYVVIATGLGAQTFTLPLSTSSSGRQLTFINKNTAGLTVVRTSPDTIDGVLTSIVLPNVNDRITFQCDGSGTWYSV